MYDVSQFKKSPDNQFVATPKSTKKEVVVNELKRNIPYLSMSIGAGLGLGLNQSNPDTYIQQKIPAIKKLIKPGSGIERLAKGFNKVRSGTVASFAIPIALSSAGYLAGKIGTGQKINKEDLSVLGSSAGATGATGLIERKLQGKNPLLSRIIGAGGSMAAGLIAADMAHRKEIEND